MKSNYVLQLVLTDNNVRFSSSKSFYSKENVETILDKISDKLSTKKSDDSIRLKMVLRDKINNISKTRYIDVDKSSDFRVLLNNMKDEVMQNKFCIEPRKNRFRVIIENSCSIQNDKKSVSINCDDEMDDVVEGLKFLFKEIINEEVDNMVVFEDDVTTPTHRILVMNCNSDEKSRGFSIILNNYSSSEISELLVDKIRGKRK